METIEILTGMMYWIFWALMVASLTLVVTILGRFVVVFIMKHFDTTPDNPEAIS